MTWHERRRDADAEWRMVRDVAEKVGCPSCNAAPGQHCRNTITGEETRFPAHPARITDAEAEQE